MYDDILFVGDLDPHKLHTDVRSRICRAISVSSQPSPVDEHRPVPRDTTCRLCSVRPQAIRRPCVGDDRTVRRVPLILSRASAVDYVGLIYLMILAVSHVLVRCSAC